MQSDEKQELEALQKEGDLPLEELLKTLPPEVLDAPAPLPPPLMEEEVEPASDHNEEAGEEEEKEKVSGSDSDAWLICGSS